MKISLKPYLIGLLLIYPLLGYASLPKPNSYVAADVLAITHVDSAATDSLPYTIPTGTFYIDLSKTSQVSGGPVNIMTLAAADADYMWGVSSGGVTYINKKMVS